jgi:hypothetical protein
MRRRRQHVVGGEGLGWIVLLAGGHRKRRREPPGRELGRNRWRAWIGKGRGEQYQEGDVDGWGAVSGRGVGEGPRQAQGGRVDGCEAVDVVVGVGWEGAASGR